MPLVGSFILPHGALTLTKDDPSIPHSAHGLHDACMEVGKQINELQPDLIFLTTPHGVSLSEDYVIYGNSKASGTAEWAGQWQQYKCEVDIDVSTSQNLNRYLNTIFNKQGIRFEMVTAFAPSESITLRWGEVIPMWFIQQQQRDKSESPKSVTHKDIFFSMPRKRMDRSAEMIPELFQIGKNLKDFFSELQERVVVVISGDLAHTHAHSFKDHPTPFGVNDNSELMDSTLEKWAATQEIGLLHVEAAKYLDTYVCGYTGFVTLSGILSGTTKWDSKVLAREHPTYYGMMIVSLHPNPAVPFAPGEHRRKKKAVGDYPMIG